MDDRQCDGAEPAVLVEWLWPLVEQPRGARVLDLGCGRALTSVFLAREFGVRVTAADLWVAPTENWERIQASGCADLVMPMHAEAYDLPFAEGYFAAIVSIAAYHYFGTDDRYLDYISRFVRSGGVIGIVMPGLTAELDELPEHLQPFWEPDFWTLHSPQWWHRHWSRSGAVTVEAADLLADGWRDWALWRETCAQVGGSQFVREMSAREGEMLRVDAGRHLGFVRLVARRIAP